MRLIPLSALQVTNSGPGAEPLTVSAFLPSFGGPGTSEGASLTQSAQPLLSGPATGVVHSIAIPSIIACAIKGPGYHGEFGGTGSVSFVLPPGQETIAFMFRAARQPPWPGTSYAPRFDVGTTPPGVSVVSPPTMQFPAPEPAYFGDSGVEIEFRTNPRSAELSRKPAKIAAGNGISVKGSTDPPLVRQRLSLMAAIPGARKPRRMATLKTNGAGRIRGSFKPTRTGTYEIWVEYASRLPGISDDFTCSRQFEISGR